MRTVLVLSGGPGLPLQADALPEAAAVVAADRGVEVAAALGLSVDLAVGDFDSVSPAALASARSIERHPAEKDATDLELALAAALRFAPERLLVLGGGAGRLDHLLGELLLLAADDFAAVQVDAQLGAARVHVVRGERALRGAPGELVSLFAAHGSARGVVTDGLVYPLRGETLSPGSSRGVSNLFAAPEARVAVGEGVVLAVRPGS